WRMAMRAIEANTFSGYGGLRQVELPKPQPVKDRVLVRVTAAGVTPLEYTVLSGGHPRANAPLVLGYKGAGVIEDAGDSGFAVGELGNCDGSFSPRTSRVSSKSSPDRAATPEILHQRGWPRTPSMQSRRPSGLHRMSQPCHQCIRPGAIPDRTRMTSPMDVAKEN